MIGYSSLESSVMDILQVISFMTLTSSKKFISFILGIGLTDVSRRSHMILNQCLLMRQPPVFALVRHLETVLVNLRFSNIHKKGDV